MGPVRQNQIQRTVRTVHLSVLIMTVHNFSTQYNIEHGKTTQCMEACGKLNRFFIPTLSYSHVG